MEAELGACMQVFSLGGLHGRHPEYKERTLDENLQASLDFVSYPHFGESVHHAQCAALAQIWVYCTVLSGLAVSDSLRHSRL